ncbi:tetratricopeptide repeat protein [Candidatus Ruminimicrobiellum ovillum]|uniref:tetratricopeptide repeat protein n=1 Tax=Candidatus Ruminimicrobiellum ovillum TaxID=1947927 RepID=UPI00355A8846
MLIKRNFIFSIVITVIFISLCTVYYEQQNKKYTIDGFIHKATHYFNNEEYIQSLRYYKKLISMSVPDEKVYINAATALIRTGYYQKAVDLLSKMEKELPPSCEMYYLLAYSNYLKTVNDTGKKDFRTSIEYLQKSIVLDSRNKDSYKLLGSIYEQKRQFEFARQWYKKASMEDIDNSGEFYGFIANTYFKQRRFEEATKYYEKALKENKNYISAYYNIAEIYKEESNFEKSEEYYKKAIEISPDYIYPYYQIGNLYFENNEYATAIEWYKKALKIEPNEQNINFFTGIAYKKINEPEKAEEHLKIAAYSGNDDALKELKGAL